MADKEEVIIWPKEEIPDEDLLFMRVHRNNIINGEPIPGVFKDHGDGMSTDWEEYSSPEETRQRARNPSANGVIKMVAGEIREIPNLQVQHTPRPENRAHTDVYGEKDTEVRLKLLRIVEWVIPVSSDAS